MAKKKSKKLVVTGKFAPGSDASKVARSDEKHRQSNLKQKARRPKQ